MDFPQNFTIFKNTNKQKPNQPDYRIMGGEPFVEIGVCWLKEKDSPSGPYKFFSCTCSKPKPEKVDDNLGV